MKDTHKSKREFGKDISNKKDSEKYVSENLKRKSITSITKLLNSTNKSKLTFDCILEEKDNIEEPKITEEYDLQNLNNP